MGLGRLHQMTPNRFTFDKVPDPVDIEVGGVALHDRLQPPTGFGRKLQLDDDRLLLTCQMQQAIGDVTKCAQPVLSKHLPQPTLRHKPPAGLGNQRKIEIHQQVVMTIAAEPNVLRRWQAIAA